MIKEMKKEYTLPTKAVELYKMIQEPAYATNKEYQKPVRTQFLNVVEGSLNGWRANSFPTVRTFENMVDELGRYPFESEYLDECYRLAEPRFIEMFPQMNKPEYIEAFRAFCDKRYHYTYLSKMCEEFTALQLVDYLPASRVYNDKFIDTIAGIDILLLVGNKYIPIHITSDYAVKQKTGVNGLQYKTGNKNIHLQDVVEGKDVMITYPRDFSNHATFAYNRYDGINNVMVNNIPLFKPEYVKETLQSFYKEHGKTLITLHAPEAIPTLIEAKLKATGYFDDYQCSYIDGKESTY